MLEKSPFRTNTKELADYYGVSERTIQRRCKDGKIQAKFDGQWKIDTRWWEKQKAVDLLTTGVDQK